MLCGKSFYHQHHHRAKKRRRRWGLLRASPPDLLANTNHNLMLYSAYNGKVALPSLTLDHAVAIGNHQLRIKVVDAQAHNLDTDTDFDPDLLLALSPVHIDPTDNAYYAYCKMLALSHLRRLDARFGGTAAHDGFEAHFGTLFIERAQAQFPLLLETPGTLNLQAVQELYHDILIALAPIDIFFNVHQYLLFLYDIFGMVGVSHQNTVVCVANVANLENAYWTGDYAVFGNGNHILYPLVSIDVVGHELSHGFVDALCGLRYQGHSGAINESYADILGSMFELYMFKKGTSSQSDWFIGENMVKTGTVRNLRNMADPHKSHTPQPRCYEGLYYISPTSPYDLGGVHINSGLLNHCFFLIATRVSALAALHLYVKCLKRMRPYASFAYFSGVLRQEALRTGFYDDVEEALCTVKLYGKPRVGCCSFWLAY
jgi:hypothetical protein